MDLITNFLINEIYPCLQGEGPNIGKPSLLVRFQICNLRCTWCDTAYTHTYKSDKFKRYSLNELTKKIIEFNVPHLILSGGEPTLQNIGILMRHLPAEYSAEVESNGTRIPHKHISGFLQSDYEKMQWNISPKFSNAGEKIVPEALTHWARLSDKLPSIFFKFVIRKLFSTDDLKEIKDIVDTFQIKKERVILMAEGTTVESQISNAWLHDECLKYGFRYSPRLHVLLFGNLRGV